MDDLLPQMRGQGDRVLIFSQVKFNLIFWKIRFVLISYLIVHNVAGCSGEISENQKSQIPAAGWTDSSSGKIYLPYISTTNSDRRGNN